MTTSVHLKFELTFSEQATKAIWIMTDFRKSSIIYSKKGMKQAYRVVVFNDY
jgi:hypothetical protein